MNFENISNFKKQLGRKGPCIGSWINTFSPVVAEIMSASGFDFLVIDAEHSAVNVPQAKSIFQAIKAGNSNCMPIVRLPGNIYSETKRYLDAGAMGVIAPLISSAKEAKELGDYLIVGVSTDHLNFSKKGKYPIYNQKDRLNIIKAIRYVDEVFYEENLEKKREYILKYKADILVMAYDWEGKFDFASDICKVIYLPRTENISTTGVKDWINQYIR